MPRPTNSKYATKPIGHVSKGSFGMKAPKAGKPTRREIVVKGGK